MIPFFKKCNLNVRIFNCNNKLIYKYTSENRNHHNKTLYAMVRGNHIYTLNNNINRIQQKICDNVKKQIMNLIRKMMKLKLEFQQQIITYKKKLNQDNIK